MLRRGRQRPLLGPPPRPLPAFASFAALHSSAARPQTSHLPRALLAMSSSSSSSNANAAAAPPKSVKRQHRAPETPANLIQTTARRRGRCRTAFDGALTPEPGGVQRGTPPLNRRLKGGVEAQRSVFPPHSPETVTTVAAVAATQLLTLWDLAVHGPAGWVGLGWDGMCSGGGGGGEWRSDTLELSSSSKTLHLVSTRTDRNRCSRRGSALR